MTYLPPFWICKRCQQWLWFSTVCLAPHLSLNWSEIAPSNRQQQSKLASSRPLNYPRQLALHYIIIRLSETSDSPFFNPPTAFDVPAMIEMRFWRVVLQPNMPHYRCKIYIGYINAAGVWLRKFEANLGCILLSRLFSTATTHRGE